ncbi:MAG: thiamine phosphate synthase [Deltaproteobacteria bacterium]|nr:thiamine phosphate synthase [Deltaproteobacteria bacterium]
MRRLLAITDRRSMGPAPIERARSLIHVLGAALWLQVREKDLSAREVCRWIEALLPDARAHGSRLFVSDRADLARCFLPEVGVQLPEAGLSVEDARRFLGRGPEIGASIHDPERVAAIAGAGGSLVVLAPIFSVPGKGPPLGIDAVRRAVELAAGRLAVFALGGVDPTTAPAIWATGADGVAATRAVWAAPDPSALLRG